MAATSTSPVKILTDLGYEMVDIESDEDYLSALMESIVSLQGAGGSGRARADILQEELVRVRKDRKKASPSKGMKASYKKISAASFKGGKKSSQGINNLISAGSSQGEGGGDLLVIKEKVVSIEALLGEQYKLQEENAKDAKQEAEQKRRSLKERLLEGGGKVWEGIKKVGEKVIKPFQSIWSKIIGFLQTVILGKILYSILEWGGKKENQDKIKSIFRFLKDWWPTLLTAYILFGTAFGRMATKLVVMVGRWTLSFLGLIPKLLAAIAKLKLGKILKRIPGGGKFAPLIKNTALIGGGMLLEKGLSGDFSGDSGETQNFATGGFVSGPGGVDQVPARLTAGEFVMSKGAVQKYGTNTLASMNAMGGGTNRPTLMGGYNEGGFANITNTLTTSSSDSDGNFGFGARYVLPEEAKERISAMGMPSMELFDGTVVPNFGQMGAESLTKGLRLTRDMMVENGASPERIAKIDELMANPNAQPGNVANMINRIVPGSTEQVMGDMGASISASARMNGGGLVQGLQGGGSVGVLGGIGNIMRGRTWSGESRGQIGRSVSNSKNISPPIKKGPKVVVVEDNDSSEADSSKAQLPTKGNREIPNFDASVHRSIDKMELLGISI